MPSVISIKQFLEDQKLIDTILGRAAELQTLKGKTFPDTLRGRIVATLFYEPSTRTRLSFETGVQRLGGNIISTENAQGSSSNVKGESLEDTIRTLNGYADAIVMRHPEKGSATRADAVSSIPIINGGDGGGDHPTQALYDLYTIRQSKGRSDKLKIALVGDVLHSRSIHALTQLLGIYDNDLYLVGPESGLLGDDALAEYRSGNARVEQSSDMESVLADADVVYINRMQKERYADEGEFEKVKDAFCITPSTLTKMKSDAIILDPLPRVNEIDPAVDDDPRALYFQQAENGLYVRMAILEYALGLL
jgi:aspartate carbamoyltransferase catalytic subunit